jgi:predicted nucleotidyltransferase
MPPADRERLTRRTLDAVRHAFGPAIVAATLHGSAWKGDFIPHYSDFDLHVFVREGLSGPRTPDLDHALALQEAVGGIRPADFAVSQIQIHLIDAAHYPPEWTPPVPGTFAVVQGALPADFPVPSPEGVRAAARAFFGSVRHDADTMLARIADKWDGRLAAYVRLFGTSLKPLAYYGAISLGADPLDVWIRPLGEILPPWPTLRRYFEDVWRWEEVRHDPARLRALVRTAYAAVGEACEAVKG